MKIERLDLREVDWGRLDSFEDRLVFQTREWVEFVRRTQGAEPVIGQIVDRGAIRGYFTGLVVRRFGFRILGSPMPGWTTAHMGFNLDAAASRRSATQALLEFAFGPLGCVHLEMRDRRLSDDAVAGLGFQATPWRGLEVDLRGDEDDVLQQMKGPCRTAIRKAAKHGVVIEPADDLEFADDFYGQLQEVFKKQSLVPPYGVERVRAMIRHVLPSGRLLLLRARSPDGECIATGIFPAANRTMHFLAGASWREHQHLRPNEALMWQAMRHWRARGIEVCDLGGFMDYKRKYGGSEVHVPFLRKSRSRRVAALREFALRGHNARQRLRGARERLR